jgi:ParB family transcriptional regulator, chromosome partitioning protein
MRPSREPAPGILPVATIKAGHLLDEPQVAEIASGIVQHGLVEPIGVVDGPEYHVVHGEKRFAAVKRLGWTEVPA